MEFTQTHHSAMQEALVTGARSLALEELIESYVCGNCMYLAAAIHRMFGWEIQATLVEPEEGEYIGHAWCIEPSTGYCVDIDGPYPMQVNGWVSIPHQLEKGLTEDTLRELTARTSCSPFTREEWDASVAEATEVLKEYVVPQLTPLN